MKYLLIRPNLLTISKLMVACLFLVLLFNSCDNEELYVVQLEEQLIEEETPKEEEEETPEIANEIFQIEVENDTITTEKNTPIALKLLDNDLSIPSTFSISNTTPQNGVLEINDNGTPTDVSDDALLYIPNSDYFGSDSFEYSICDASSDTENCATARVDILINNVISDDIATELKAFPTAYGDGAYTTGGRGGNVIRVTNLNDSGAGSFRAALQMTVPRIIVFDVSGVINLSSILALNADNGNVTIAGQTAPEGGITIAGNRFYVYNVQNIIVRYIRFKGGATVNNDSVTVTGDILDQIWDHCSFGFGTDEGASWYSGTTTGTNQNRITVQRCLWNENSKGAILGKQNGNGGTPPTGSFISNMFYNSGYRFPNISSSGVGQFDIINNVAWGITNRLLRGNGAFKLNHIGNYYNYGSRGITDVRTNLFAFGDVPQIFNSNNKIVAPIESTPLTYTVNEMNNDGDRSWGFFQDGNGFNYGDRLPSNYFSSTQHNLLGATFTPLSGDSSFSDVLINVGCNARLNPDGSISSNLDVLDANALNQVGQGNFVDKLLKSEYIIPQITSITRPTNYDTDNDGMPNVWELSNGYNPNFNDSAEDRDGDGYTNLEEFLNIIDK